MRRHKRVFVTLVIAVMILYFFNPLVPQSVEPSLVGMPFYYLYIVVGGLLCTGSTALIFALVWPKSDPEFDDRPSEERSEGAAQ